MISDIFTNVVAQPILLGVASRIGSEYLDYADDPLPRMVWVPGIDTFRNGYVKRDVYGRTSGQQLPKPFLTRHAQTKVHIWAKSQLQASTSVDDIRAVEILLRKVLVAVRAAAFGDFHAGEFIWSGGDGEDFAENGRNGMLTLTFDVPIYATAEEQGLTTAIATTETQTGTMDFTDGDEESASP